MQTHHPDPTVLHVNPAVTVAPTTPHGRSVVLHPFLYAALGLLLLFGTIQVSKGIGFWTTSGRVTGTGQPVVLTGNDPLEIKGWMTIEQVAEAYRVPPAELKANAGIPPSVPDATALRDIERLAPGFSAQRVRNWLLARQK